MLDSHVSACLEKNWSVFAMLIGLVRRLVNSPCFTRAMRHRARHLLRMAEAFARRLLVLRAKDIAPAHPRPSNAQTTKTDPQTRPAGPRTHSFSLAEPLPDLIPLSDEPFPEPEPLDIAATDPDEIMDPDRTARRLGALEDILLRPAHHARRMARWLKRFTARTNRFHPFCVGRPPGTSRRPRDPDLDRQLRDTDFFARRVLSAAPG